MDETQQALTDLAGAVRTLSAAVGSSGLTAAVSAGSAATAASIARHNPDLDAAFGEPPAPPVAPATAATLRENELLDDIFGESRSPTPATAAVTPVAATQVAESVAKQQSPIERAFEPTPPASEAADSGTPPPSPPAPPAAPEPEPEANPNRVIDVPGFNRVPPETSPTPAFDRPQPVVIVGPSPLPVSVTGAIRALGGEGPIGGSEEKEREKSDYERDKEAHDKESLRRQRQAEREAQTDQMVSEATPGGSGRNLTDFGRSIVNIGRKVRNRLRGKLKPPNRADYNAAGKRLPKGRVGKPSAGSPGAPAARGGAAVAEAGGTAEGGAAAAGAGAEGGVAGVLGAEAAGGPIGWVAAVVTVLGVAAMEAGKAVYKFARAQEKEVERLAQFGGQQAAAVAKLEADRVSRDVRTAGETGQSSTHLMDSLSKFEDKLQPIESLLTNVSNTVGGILLDILGGMLDAVKPVVTVLTNIYNKIPGEKIQDPVSTWDYIKQLEEEQKKLNQPRWPSGPVGNTRPIVPQ